MDRLDHYHYTTTSTTTSTTIAGPTFPKNPKAPSGPDGPKCPKDPWVQALDDMPEGTLSDFVVKEAAGHFDISCTYPKKELWQDYIETCEKAAAAADGQAEGELPCCTIVVS